MLGGAGFLPSTVSSCFFCFVCGDLKYIIYGNMFEML